MGQAALGQRAAAPGRPRAPLRNHGLFSKAERALEIAGWSEKARRDVEVFPLEDTEGLTPLLMVLNDAGAPAHADDRMAPAPTAKASA